jgi:hypothetical protein
MAPRAIPKLGSEYNNNGKAKPETFQEFRYVRKDKVGVPGRDQGL